MGKMFVVEARDTEEEKPGGGGRRRSVASSDVMETRERTLQVGR